MGVAIQVSLQPRAEPEFPVEVGRRHLLRYTQALITQMVQTAACNRHHSVEQQLCRWLLLTLDRLPSSELIMTQELGRLLSNVRYRQGFLST